MAYSFYCKQTYATCFDLYLGHHQANNMKYKLSYLNLVAPIWIHIIQFIVVCNYKRIAIKIFCVKVIHVRVTALYIPTDTHTGALGCLTLRPKHIDILSDI